MDSCSRLYAAGTISSNLSTYTSLSRTSQEPRGNRPTKSNVAVDEERCDVAANGLWKRGQICIMGILSLTRIPSIIHQQFQRRCWCWRRLPSSSQTNMRKHAWRYGGLATRHETTCWRMAFGKRARLASWIYPLHGYRCQVSLKLILKIGAGEGCKAEE